ncbi:MAG: hypothetical protein IPF87_11975 [Gemmatimonadetes bacterium]|jgi:hypothetical protein|nr:hypothetical protein [Gemmatimonadota bacterium]MCC7323149.1 hypothetical protein [Gemmatimonadaceae bacterium]MBK6456772.1 hypothetical protein [Gemmatimonadota bacterium]MBK6842296.1 hypothetical protein [Gemmatimonadota bacterium]MBK7836001.1 hypothetical protein [Gemmatimonadota bacterium]
MNRATRFAAYLVVAASLAACSSSPMGPEGAARCDAKSAQCVNPDFVNPHVDFVNPHVDFVNPHV